MYCIDQYRAKREMWKKYTMKFRKVPPQEVWDDLVRKSIRQNHGHIAKITWSSSSSTNEWNNNNRTDVFINLDDCILQNKNSKTGLIPINYRETKLIRRPESKQAPGEPLEMREKKYARLIDVQEQGCGKLIRRPVSNLRLIRRPVSKLRLIRRPVSKLRLIRRPVSKLRLMRRPVSKQVPEEQIEIHEKRNKRVISVQEDASEQFIKPRTAIHNIPSSVVRACRTASDVSKKSRTIALKKIEKENIDIGKTKEQNKTLKLNKMCSQ